MQHRAIPLILTVAALALGANTAVGADAAKSPAKPAASAPATKSKEAPATKSKEAPATKSKEAPAQAKPAAKKAKPVDINSATVEQLAEVPGLDKAHAMKIVSNRPYPTRAWLVTKGVLSELKYAEIKDFLVASPNTAPKAPVRK